MDFSEAIKSVYGHYTDFEGRARRSEFWFYHLFNCLVVFAVQFISIALDNQNLYVIFALIWVAANLLPALSVCIRRLHDIGYSGWAYFVCLIPVIGGILLLIWFCRDSVPGVNEYGPNPKESYKKEVPSL